MAQFVQVVYLSGHLHLPETLSSLWLVHRSAICTWLGNGDTAHV
ncbi:hypothetical protein CCUS01_02557 [Colletotrichum cuscutae]|uniref:Uncharacterized protein n=1 Tax=Colletotrichum cuscutae TaxID=1209917 RepID=A0AAI9YDG3_9PEZI|nr:hypothetical protein CCUS01_02557 [Colletotrichum cuscutae]